MTFLTMGPASRLRAESSFQTLATAADDPFDALARLAEGSLARIVAARAALARPAGVEALSTLRVSQGRADEDAETRVRVADVRSALAEKDGLVVVDNRGATPYLCRPLRMGADVVLEDPAEVFGLAPGQAPADGGSLLAIARTPAAWERFREAFSLDGDSASPCCDGRLLALGVATLSMRVARACDNALALAHYASKHPLVASVSYPGLGDDPANAPARRNLEHGFGRTVVLRLLPEAAEGLSRRPGAWEAGRGSSPLRTSARLAPGDALVVDCGVESPLDIVAAVERLVARVG